MPNPKPPNSLFLQIDSQSTQTIFECSSHPPHKNLLKIDSIEVMIPKGALTKEKA